MFYGVEVPESTQEATEAAEASTGSKAGVGPTPMPQALRGRRGFSGGVRCWDGSVDERSLQLLKAMREQLGENTGTHVDAGIAAKRLWHVPQKPSTAACSIWSGRIHRGVRRSRHELA